MMLFSLAVLVMAQTKAAPPVSPVTCTEARTFLQRVQNALVVVNRIKNPSHSLIHPSRSPITREAVILEFKRIFDMTQPFFTYKGNPAQFDPKVIRLSSASSLRAAMTLTSWGCLNRVGPLLTGPGDHLTPQQFGDASGLFLSRLAELTHTPTIEFSPYLQH
jgi:hypothetical protein